MARVRARRCARGCSTEVGRASAARVGDGRAARAPAQRDDAADAAARASRGVYSPERAPAPAAGDGAPAAWCGRRRPVPARRAEAEFAYDNERPQHMVDVPAFGIDRRPVTNGAYREFIDDGGYRRRELWTDEGWAWRERERDRAAPATGPAATAACAASTASEPLDPDLPVMHVSWYEADAYARWRGQAPADRGRVGEGGVVGRRGRRASAATRGATSAPDDRAREPRPARLRPGAGGRLPGRSRPYGVPSR